jgi:DNA-binding winged helix-turn-helix (wHTH) protein/tetratricopeptide (TPR) repeat protein
MANVHSPAMVRAYRFGPYELDPAGELRKFDSHIKIQKKPFLLLLALVERPGEIVSRAELQQRLWPGTFVDFEQNLNIAVKKVRDALCDTTDDPKFIETIPGQGYRFLAPVERIKPAQDMPAAETGPLAPTSEPGFTPGVRRWFSAAVLALIIVAILAAYIWRSHHVLAFEPRDWILIADFDNRTGDRLLNGALEQALQREISNSQYVNVAPRERLYETMRLMRKPLETPIDRALGREICLRDGHIRLLVTGSIEKFGERYLLDVDVVKPDSNSVVISVEEQAENQTALLQAVHRAANEVRRRLGEALPQIEATNQMLAKVTTPSLQALQLYSRGEAAIAAGKSQIAEPLLREAIAADPQFASAYTLMEYALEHQGRPFHESEPFAEKGFQLAESVPPRERLFIQATYFGAIEDRERAIKAYEALITMYPDHYWAPYNLFLMYRQAGRREQAHEWLTRAADERPNDKRLNQIAWGRLNNYDEPTANRFLRRWLALDPDYRETYPASGAAVEWRNVIPHLRQRDLKGAIDEAHRSEQVFDALPVAGKRAFAQLAFSFYMQIGRLHEAEQWLKKIPAPGDPVLNLMLAEERGDRTAALATANNLKNSLKEDQFGDYVPRFAALGMLAEAKRGANSLRKDLVGATYWQTFGVGVLAYAEHRDREAIQRLRHVATFMPAGQASFAIALWLARALERTGDVQGAIAVLEPLNRTPRIVYYPAGYMPNRARAHLAELYRRTGRREEAQKIETDLLSILQYADPDYPLLVELNGRSKTPTTLTTQRTADKHPDWHPLM